MALTQAHDERRTLSPEQVEELCKLPFLQIMDLPAIKRAEVLEALYEKQARVLVKTTGKEDIRFSFTNSHMAGARELEYIVPSGSKDPAALPLRAAVYIAANLSYPQFGGAHLRQTGALPDGRPLIEPVPANPSLLMFELVAS